MGTWLGFLSASGPSGLKPRLSSSLSELAGTAETKDALLKRTERQKWLGKGAAFNSGCPSQDAGSLVCSPLYRVCSGFVQHHLQVGAPFFPQPEMLSRQTTLVWLQGLQSEVKNTTLYDKQYSLASGSLAETHLGTVPARPEPVCALPADSQMLEQIFLSSQSFTSLA